jgi:glycogen synthase
MRIAYLSGPVDGVNVLNTWKARQELAYFGASPLTDFFELCADFGAQGYVITTLDSGYSCYRTENVLIENRPPPSQYSGMRYHIANAFWLIGLLPKILRFRPHMLVITAAQNYWFLLAALKLRKITIVPAIACTLWPQYRPQRASLKILLRLNRLFFRHCVDAIMVASEDIAVQVRMLLGGRALHFATFLPMYRRSQFMSFHSADLDQRPFRIFFAGRIETNKGVYDLVKIAQSLEKRTPRRFHLDICGDGSELARLRQHIAELRLTDMITCHGFCNRDSLSVLMQASHLVIVPTTTQFEEGFNMVCAEAILAQRPLVTSAVCPALAYVNDAAIEVPPDDVEAYCNAVFELSNDRTLYETKQKACKALQEQFYDVSNSWGAKLHEILVKVLPMIDAKSESP